jgi:hypothetical protein
MMQTMDAQVGGCMKGLLMLVNTVSLPDILTKISKDIRVHAMYQTMSFNAMLCYVTLVTENMTEDLMMIIESCYRDNQSQVE